MTKAKRKVQPDPTPNLAQLKKMAGKEKGGKKSTEVVLASEDSLSEIASSINKHWADMADGMMVHCWHIGRLLTKAKAGMVHGEWMPWCKKNLAFSHSHLNKLMAIGELPLKPEMPKSLGDEQFRPLTIDMLAQVAGRVEKGIGYETALSDAIKERNIEPGKRNPELDEPAPLAAKPAEKLVQKSGSMLKHEALEILGITTDVEAEVFLTSLTKGIIFAGLFEHHKENKAEIARLRAAKKVLDL